VAGGAEEAGVGLDHGAALADRVGVVELEWLAVVGRSAAVLAPALGSPGCAYALAAVGGVAG
jgi:hypothetical protein